MLRFNPMKDGPINVDWQLTPVEGLVQIGSVKPFPLEEFYQGNMSVDPIRENMKKGGLQRIRDNIRILLAKMGADSCDESSWANSEGAPAWHTDTMRVGTNTMLIMSLTPDPNRITTQFKTEDDQIFSCKSWHLYLVRSVGRKTLPHSGPSGFWKVFLRFYANLPFEV